MNSILTFIYLLIFQPCDTVLYTTLAIISVISILIIVQQSRPIDPIYYEDSSLLVTRQHKLDLPRTAPQQSNYVPQHESSPESQSPILESEDQSEPYQDETHPYPAQSSRTSISIHDIPPPNIHPPHAIAPAHQQDTLLHTGALFPDDHHNFNPFSPQSRETDLGSDASTSSLDLNG